MGQIWYTFQITIPLILLASENIPRKHLWEIWQTALHRSQREIWSSSNSINCLELDPNGTEKCLLSFRHILRHNSYCFLNIKKHGSITYTHVFCFYCSKFEKSLGTSSWIILTGLHLGKDLKASNIVKLYLELYNKYLYNREKWQWTLQNFPRWNSELHLLEINTPQQKTRKPCRKSFPHLDSYFAFSSYEIVKGNMPVDQYVSI